MKSPGTRWKKNNENINLIVCLLIYIALYLFYTTPASSIILTTIQLKLVNILAMLAKLYNDQQLVNTSPMQEIKKNAGQQSAAKNPSYQRIWLTPPFNHLAINPLHKCCRTNQKQINLFNIVRSNCHRIQSA